jgi:hypothetical protein
VRVGSNQFVVRIGGRSGPFALSTATEEIRICGQYLRASPSVVLKGDGRVRQPQGHCRRSGKQMDSHSCHESNPLHPVLIQQPAISVPLI